MSSKGLAKKGGNSNITCTDGAQGSGCGTNVYHWDTGTTQVSAAGSSTVFVNGKAAGRIGDRVSCGSVSAQGSPSVFIG
jgi:uncharacterized Zn-binding protein involved in type VI secretion